MNGQYTCSCDESDKDIVYHTGGKLIGVRRTEHPTSDYPDAFSDLLSLGPVAVHAVLDGLVAGLTDGPAGHFDSQPRFCAPLDGSLESPTIPI